MKNTLTILLLIALLGGLGFIGWKTFFPDEKQKIREMLHELDAAADISSAGKPLSKLSKAGDLTGFFTDDTEIKVSRGGGAKISIKGKDQLLQSIVGVQSLGKVINVQLKDPIIELAESGKATIELTAIANTTAGSPPIVQMIEFQLVKIRGDWKIRKASTKETFKRLE